MSDRDNITLPRELVQEALEALEFAERHNGGDDCYADSITALRKALAAEPTKQESVESDDDEEFTRQDVTTLLLEVMDWTYAKAHRERPMTEAEQKVLDDIRTALAAEKRHPDYVIGNHWFETAYERLCAGEAEDAILEDYELVREPRLRDLRRDAERFWMVVAAMNEKPKPVAWMFVNLDGECEQIEYGTPPTDDDSITPLYIAPPEDEALRRDAERYRWLRERAWFQFEFEGRYGDSGETVQELDAAIDAAMEASTAPASAAADSSTAPEAKP